MKLASLWKLTLAPDNAHEDLTPEEKVIRMLGFVYVKAASEKEAKLKTKLLISKVERIGIFADEK